MCVLVDKVAHMLMCLLCMAYNSSVDTIACESATSSRLNTVMHYTRNYCIIVYAWRNASEQALQHCESQPQLHSDAVRM
jgi:hypothetical protein